jgi:hypothetical protein
MRRKHPDGRPYVSNNPARDVEKLRYGSVGFHTWTSDEVSQYEAPHPVGTKARVALAGDVIRFGKQHVHNGKLTFTQRKGRHHKPKQLVLPILPVLQRIIDASPCGDLTFLVNKMESSIHRCRIWKSISGMGRRSESAALFSARSS